MACDLVRYYQTVGRDLTAANIQWNQVMSNLEIQWKALKDREDEDDPDVPKTTKALPIIKWTEAFQDFLHRVIGRNAYILSKIGETVDVAPFTPDYKPISVELVDAALKYECPYSGEVKIPIIRRRLHVPSMTHNLLPPFMLREAGIQINEVPKIHVTSPTEEHHAIIFQEKTFRIPLTLHGTFSYFPTSKPTTQELEKPEDVYILTPTTWNPHSDAYVINEESMLDWEGNMKHERDHEKRVVLEDIPSDDTMISSLALCEKEQMAVSSYFVYQDEDVNATYGFEDEHQLYHALNMRNEHGQFAMSIGATSILDQPYLDDDDDSQDSSDEDDISQDDSDDDFDLKELDDDTNEALLDNFMASTAQAGKPEELTKNIFPRFGELVMKMPKGPLMSLPKHPFQQMIQPYQETTQPMIGCSGTKGSRTISSWIPFLQPRKEANHLEVILAVNFLSLIKDSFMLFQ